MIRWLRDLWWRRQRSIDLDCLWPACKEMAGGDLDRARGAFMLHAINDDAWVGHYGGDLWTQIQQLK